MGKLFLVSIATVSLSAFAGAVTVYDNFGHWSGEVTNGWDGQAQMFVVPVNDNVLLDWRSQFHSDMTGRTVNFSIRDFGAGAPGGATYYSNSAVVPVDGIVMFSAIGASLVSGQQYMAVWDFNGYSGLSIHFTGVDVVPGHAFWQMGGVWHSYPSLDQKLTATFGDSLAVVPGPPAALPLIILALARLRRSKR
jgi:hypothetical protein